MSVPSLSLASEGVFSIWHEEQTKRDPVGGNDLPHQTLLVQFQTWNSRPPKIHLSEAATVVSK